MSLSYLTIMSYKVIHFISSIDLASGGPSRSMPSICLGMKSVGVDCEVRSRDSEHPNDKKLLEASIPVTLVKKEGGIRPLLRNYLTTGIVWKNSIAHIQNIWDLALHWVVFECRKNGTPYLISPRGMLEPWSLRQKKLKKKLALALYQMNDLKHAACIHTTALSEMEHVRALGVKCPIAVIPNGIKVEDYAEKDYDKIKTGKKRMLFLSRIHPKKGIELLLKAWSQLPKELLDEWELVIAGEGDKSYSLDDLNGLIRRNFKHLNVVVIGPQYGIDKLKTYQSADIFVLPTHSENFGMVIAEAMCCGLPVITTTGTPWKELKDEHLGWYIELSVENLREALIDAMSQSDDKLIELGKRSRELILKEYSIDAVAIKYKHLYGWLSGECTKPSFVYE